MADSRSYWLFAISPVSSGANFSGLPPSGASSPRPRLPGSLPPPTLLRHSFSQKVVFSCLVQIIALKPDSDKCLFARPASPDALHLPQEPIRSQIEMHPDWLGHPLIVRLSPSTGSRRSPLYICCRNKKSHQGFPPGGFSASVGHCHWF